MFHGSDLRLQLHAPDLDTPITRPARVKVDDRAVEFDNAAFFDLNGDPYEVVDVRIDQIGAVLHLDILQSFGTYANVDDDTGFNGYALTYGAITSNPRLKIIDADILTGWNLLEVPEENITHDANTLFINVDGLIFNRGDNLAVELGFQIKGTRGRDLLEGGSGDDRLLGAKGSDMLLGGRGTDVLKGGGGGDILDGGTNRDKLAGGAGADMFVLRSTGGRDTVTDFGNGNDTILVQTTDTRFAQLEIAARGDDTLVTSDGAALLLKDVAPGDLSRSDFDFG